MLLGVDGVIGGRGWLELEDKQVLVLGASSFGRACVRGFLDEGARVLAADRSDGALKDLRVHVGNVGSEDLLTRTVDVRSSDDCRGLAEFAKEHLGGLDVVVHAVGTNDRREVRDTSDASWAHVLETNLTSAFWLARETLDLLRVAEHGKMVFFSSVSASLAHPRHGAYAASKGGLNQLIKVLAIELAEDGVHVNGVAPGYVETNLTADYLANPGTRADLTARVPMGRLGVIEDVVGPTLFLSSSRSNFTTGQVLVVDGGRTLD